MRFLFCCLLKECVLDLLQREDDSMFKKNKNDNKKILESRRLIKEAQETIRLEKINIKKSKR